VAVEHEDLLDPLPLRRSKTHGTDKAEALTRVVSEDPLGLALQPGIGIKLLYPGLAPTSSKKEIVAL
jgi:hypothetical protein